MKPFLILSLLFAFISCDNQSKLQREIKYREQQQITNKKDLNQTKEDFYLLIETYEDYIQKFPEAPDAADVSYKLAKQWIDHKKYDKALDLIDLIYEKYPKYEMAVEVLLLKGFLLENKLNRRKEAKMVYEKIIKSHPEHPLAKEAILLLKSL